MPPEDHPMNPMQRAAAVARASRGPALLAAALVALALAGCGEKKDKVASQTAAKVNKDEITVHQINFVLQQQRGLRPEQTDAASRQVLERLIDQQLALQKADDLKLDRDPRVVQALDAARREIIARAYLERVGEGAAKPTAEEIKKYYDDNPALFRERRIYNFQELAVEARPEQVETLRAKLAEAKNLNEFVEYLKANDFRFGGSQAVRAAEQLPLQNLKAFASMKDGQAMVVPTTTGAQVVVLAGSRSQPVGEEQARPAIEQFIANDRKRKLVEEDIKALRGAARVEYVGKFAEKAASAPAAAASAASAPAAPAATAASGPLSPGEISKGMGLK
jgi:EpsD family peptidyl-prolyl cis-trans isomerase